MSRIVDKPYFTYSAYNALTSGIQVKCPKCHGTGMVTADDDNAYFRCLSCGHQETRDRTIYRYDVHNQCKNCGRYFAVMRHGATEYCGRVADERGRTCREVGAINTWTRSKRDDEVFKVYRREYKKRFAWIKAGRITDQQFYDWSERARAEKDKCEQGLISQKELEAWLKESK
jgi:predicted RNA-binding Zn-ribbon protein involved in translation (DUF1610 family)